MSALHTWHDLVRTPQLGKAITARYLAAAFQVFFNESFRYVREIAGPRDAALEFQVEIDGIAVNGIDLIKWNDAAASSSSRSWSGRSRRSPSSSRRWPSC